MLYLINTVDPPLEERQDLVKNLMIGRKSSTKKDCEINIRSKTKISQPKNWKCHFNGKPINMLKQIPSIEIHSI